MSPGQRGAQRIGFNAYLTADDMKRLERLAAKVASGGKANKTLAVQRALKALERELERKQEEKK